MGVSQIILKVRQAKIISAQIFDTILTIPVKFGLIWFDGFRGEDLNVKVNHGRRADRRKNDDKCRVMTKAHLAFGQVS
jgi:hypothetical protein